MLSFKCLLFVLGRLCLLMCVLCCMLGAVPFGFALLFPHASAAEGGRCSGAFNTGSSQKCVFIIKLESPTIINSQVSCYLWLTEN